MYIQSIANYGDLFFPPNLFFNNKVVSFYSFDNKTPGIPPAEHELWCKTTAAGTTINQSLLPWLMTTDTLLTSPGHVILGKIYTTLHCTTSVAINGGWCANNGGQHRYYYFTNGSNQPVKLPAGWTGKILFFGQSGTAYNIFSMPIDYDQVLTLGSSKLWAPDGDCHSSSIKIYGDTSGYLQVSPFTAKGQPTQASGKFYNPAWLNKVVVQLPGAQSSTTWSAGTSPTLAKGIKMYLDRSKIHLVIGAPPLPSYPSAKYHAINVMGYYDYPNPIPVDFYALDHNTDHGGGGCNNAYWKGLGVIVITTNDKVPITY